MKGVRVCSAVLVAIALMAWAGSPAFAQQTESRIVGRLVDDSKAALPGVTITITSRQTGAVRTMVTESDGSYVVTNLGPGTYTIQAELQGFAPRTKDIVLGVGQVEAADFVMGIAGLAGSVTVTADAQVLDVSSARIGVNVSPEEVENLPVNGRNFANLMTLATGATSDGNGGWASVRFNGKSNQQNYLNYDGVDGTLRLGREPRLPERHGLAVPPADLDGVGRRVPRQLGPRPGGERPGRRRQHHGHQQERQQPLSRLALRVQA